MDGGKGQLSAAREAMEEAGAAAVPTVGLAKEREELFLPGQSEPVMLPRNSQGLYLVQRIRDEAHRFALAYHQRLRKEAGLHSPAGRGDGHRSARARPGCSSASARWRGCGRPRWRS